MQVEQLLSCMSEEIYLKFQDAIATGKWLDGNPLTDEQKDTVLQAILLYQAKIEQSEEHMTIGKDGQIVQKSRQQLQQEFKQKSTNQVDIARFKQNDI